MAVFVIPPAVQADAVPTTQSPATSSQAAAVWRPVRFSAKAATADGDDRGDEDQEARGVGGVARR